MTLPRSVFTYYKFTGECVIAEKQNRNGQMAVSILYPSRRIVRIGHHGNFFVDKQKRKRKQKRNELTNVFRIFSDFWRRATRCRQKSKKMLNETVAFFPIFGGVLRTAAKNRKKCLMKPWHFFRFWAACYAPPPKIEKNA